MALFIEISTTKKTTSKLFSQRLLEALDSDDEAELLEYRCRRDLPLLFFFFFRPSELELDPDVRRGRLDLRDSLSSD